MKNPSSGKPGVPCGQANMTKLKLQYGKSTVKRQLYLLAISGWIIQQFTATCFGLYRPSSVCTTSCYKVKLYNMQGACYWWRDLVHMNYILSYNYCNLDKVEYSGTDITCLSAFRTSSLTQVISVPLYSTLSILQ